MAQARVGRSISPRRRSARKSATASRSAASPPDFNKCPACGFHGALDGRVMIATVPGEEQPYTLGRMLVCANCGQTYMALIEGGVSVPKMAYGFTQKPPTTIPQPEPNIHTPDSGPQPQSDLRWNRRRA